MPRGTSLRRTLTQAIHALQFHYDTPHALICHDATARLRARLRRSAREEVTRRHAAYVKGSPAVSRRAVRMKATGGPDVDDDAKGMLDALAGGSVFNAHFCALRMLKRRGTAELEAALLALAANEVDGLGHVFIYTDSALRLMRQSSPVPRDEILLGLTEFLARRATFSVPEKLRPCASREGAYRAALERVGLLGHNAIYARSLELRREEMPADVFDHALAQLERNVSGAQDAFTLDEMNAIPPQCSARRPSEVLLDAVASGDERTAVALVRGYLASNEVKNERIWEALVLGFARVDVLQPHYLIFPDAAWFLADVLGGVSGLAACAVAREATRAAKKSGMRK